MSYKDDLIAKGLSQGVTAREDSVLDDLPVEELSTDNELPYQLARALKGEFDAR